MAFGDIGSPEAVRRAIRECDQMGRDAFLEHYHFKRAEPTTCDTGGGFTTQKP